MTSAPWRAARMQMARPLPMPGPLCCPPPTTTITLPDKSSALRSLRWKSSDMVLPFDGVVRVCVDDDVQVGEPAQDVGGHIGVATVMGGPMRLGVDSDVGGPLQQSLKKYPRLGAGQRGPDAAVYPSTETDVAARIQPIRVEHVGIVENARIAVGGAVVQHQRGARGDVDTADRRRGARQPEVALVGAFEEQRLFY